MQVRNIFFLLATILLIGLFSGCFNTNAGEDALDVGALPVSDDAQALAESVVCGAESNLDPGKEEVAPFNIVLPDIWKTQVSVEYVDNGADIRLDGGFSFSLRLVENAPGAREQANALESGGYYYFFRTDAHFYFRQIDGVIPKEWYLSDEDLTPKAHTQKAFNGVFGIPQEDISPTNAYDYPVGMFYNPIADFSYALGGNTYTNYWMGISFSIPDSMLDKYTIIEDAHTVSIHLRVENKNAPDLYERYVMCQIFALPPDDDRVGTPYTDPEIYPEIQEYPDGYFYGAINLWQPDVFRPGEYKYESYWKSIPLKVRRLVSTSEVQGIVDSFTVLPEATDSNHE